MTDSPLAAEPRPGAGSPPPPPPIGASDDAPIPGPGQTTFGWRVTLFMLWMLAIASISSVWQVAARIGHTTWWLGPAGEPRPLLVQLTPFFGPILVLVMIIVNSRWMPLVAGLVSVGLIGLGAIDLGYYERLGVIEIATGGLCLIATLVALVGRVPSRSRASSID